MPHVSLCSYPCLPSWLQSLLSTQLKTNSSRPGETPGRTFVFIKWIWGEQVCFAGSGSLPLSPCLSVLPGSGWWSRERRLTACQRDPLAAWTQAPDIRWDRGSPPPSCWRQTQTDHKSARCYGCMDHHHGKRSSLSALVFSINTLLLFAESTGRGRWLRVPVVIHIHNLQNK